MLGATYSAFRLLISSQTNVDAYHEVGNLIPVGWARYFGHQYSRGRVLETQPNLAVSESADWVTRSSVVSPPRRVVDFAWTEGIETSQVYNDAAVPDYVIASGNAGAKAGASARGTPSVMSGLWDSMFRATAGANSGIVVYLPSVAPVAASSPDVIMLNRRHQFVVGRIAQPLRIETYTGSENSSEVQRLASISIQEII